MKFLQSMTVLAAVAIGCRSGARNAAPGDVHDTAIARTENDRAYKLIQDQKYDQAAEALKRSIDADVMYGPAHNNMGLVYFYQDKLYLSAWEFQNAIKLMPYQPEPRNNLGLVFEKAGKVNNAAEAYGKARELEPDNPEYISNLARAHVRRGDNDEETRKLLEEVVMKDSRPEWAEWARMNLFRLKRAGEERGSLK